MNGEAVRKLRRQFILAATLSFFVVILIMGVATAMANYWSMRSQASFVINLIVENNGVLPESIAENKERERADEWDLLSTDFFFGTRYFSVVLSPSGQAVRVNVERIASVSETDAVNYARKVRAPLLGVGTVDTFYYGIHEMGDGNTMVVFLDYATQMRINQQVLKTTMLICGASLAVTFIVVVLVSSRAIRPEIENARKQRQFITNASHELKTPLAVIRANTEVMEMLHGEDEWTLSTRRQVDRMDGLVQNLVMIARAEEREAKGEATEIDVTQLVRDSVEPFQALALQDRLNLVSELEEGVRMEAQASAVQQLTTLLVDNAIKYCDPGGDVRVTLTSPRKGKLVQLVVSNSFAAGETRDYSRFFERFYRDDESHSDQGGYGIGLSVAESICQRYGGSIRASWKDGAISFTCLLRSR